MYEIFAPKSYSVLSLYTVSIFSFQENVKKDISTKILLVSVNIFTQLLIFFLLV